MWWMIGIYWRDKYIPIPTAALIQVSVNYYAALEEMIDLIPKNIHQVLIEM